MNLIQTSIYLYFFRIVLELLICLGHFECCFIIILFYYPILILFGQSNCIDWITFCYIYGHWPKLYSFSGIPFTFYVKLVVNQLNFCWQKISKAQALVSFKKYMPPPLPYFKVTICPFPLPHFASICFAYLWSFRWPNYIVTLPRYFSFRLTHLNIPTGFPSDELDKNIQRKYIIGSAKGSQINEKYWGEVGKGKRADAYLEVRKRRGHIFFEWNKCLWSKRIII